MNERIFINMSNEISRLRNEVSILNKEIRKISIYFKDFLNDSSLLRENQRITDEYLDLISKKNEKGDDLKC